jgi:alpha-beta hydrolase superfamily lysophospholipase
MTKRENEKLERRAVPGPALHYVTVLPEGAKAIIGLVHGYADHAERYAHVQEAWAERGIASVAIDMRGHGRADGRRGHCSRFEEYLDDVGELERLVADRAGSATKFLFGHSFGGLVVARKLLLDPSPWKAVILSSPFFGIGMRVPAAKVAAGKIASRVWPTLAIPVGISGNQVTHDPERARVYETDPLVFKKATARWFTEMQRAQRAALAGAHTLKLPLYAVFGEDDPLVSVPIGRSFFDAVASEDKTWDGRPGLLHETWNETEAAWKSVVGAIADWVLKRA